jgi:hypothetical protein
MRAKASSCPQEAFPLLDPSEMGLKTGTPGSEAAAGSGFRVWRLAAQCSAWKPELESLGRGNPLVEGFEV